MAEPSSGSNNNSSSSLVATARLTEFEDGALKTGANPPSTITWCSGNSEDSSRILQQRLLAVIAANPWLAGRIVQQDGGKNYLEYSTTREIQTASDPSVLSGIFRKVESSTPLITKKTPFGQVGRILADAGIVLRFGHDPDKPLFLVSVIVVSSRSFAIVVSMSHIIGDGHTFYSIYNMLTTTTTTTTTAETNIVSLDVDRVDIELKQVDNAMGKIESRMLSSGGFVLAAIRGVLSSTILGLFFKRWKVETRCWLIDAEKMNQLKSDASSTGSSDNDNNTVPFVSTNDVLTSWYLRNSNCRHGLMAIDLRHRIEIFRDDMAGNYENLIYYRIPDDCATAASIRRSLPPLRRTVTGGTPPTTLEVSSGNFAIISSWASFAGDKNCRLSLGSDCREEGHLPIYDSSRAPASISMAFIFRYTPGQLGVMVLGTPDQLAGLENAPFVSDKTIDCHF